MSSNLPPGVTESMIPGNRPEDEEWERALELIEDDARAAGLTGPEAVAVFRGGLSAWETFRKHEDAQREEEDQGVIEVFFDHEETRWVARHGVYFGRGAFPQEAIIELSKNPNVILPRPIRRKDEVEEKSCENCGLTEEERLRAHEDAKKIKGPMRPFVAWCVRKTLTVEGPPLPRFCDAWRPKT